VESDRPVPRLLADTVRAIVEILRVVAPPLALVVLLVTLVFSRGTLSLEGYAIALALALIAVGAFARRRGQARIWVLYLVGFIFFAHLRSLMDETGITTQTGYVIDMEQALFFGTVPTAWLQEHLFRGGVGLIEALSTIVYVTYFLAPHVAEPLIWLYRRFVLAVRGSCTLVSWSRLCCPRCRPG